MKLFLFLMLLVIFVESAYKTVHGNKKNVTEPTITKTESTSQKNVTKDTFKMVAPSVTKFKKKHPNKNKHAAKMITRSIVQTWASEISNRFIEHEESVVHRSELTKAFANIKMEIRNGSEIADKLAASMSDLLERRASVAESIMRKAEQLAEEKQPVPSDYVFDASKELDKVKQLVLEEKPGEIPLNCTRSQKVNVSPSTHFQANVTFESSSAQVTVEVFDCDPPVLDALHWSEGLISVFRQNYAQDASLSFQHFCSAKGFLRHYPGASWESMLSLDLEDDDVADIYDCRLRPWYVGAGGAPRDIVILIDATGSMKNSSNNVIAKHFTMAFLSALTDDDYVNVFRFHTQIMSPISCFNDKLVPANHVNSAAMMEAMEGFKVLNTTVIEDVLEFALKLLQSQRETNEHPTACQQAIVLLADSVYTNATERMMEIDPEGHVRLFTIWLHDENGLRDDTRLFGEYMTCARDGLFVELKTPAAVTRHVLDILAVLERPLVIQRDERLRVFTDMYAHLEDPRKGEYHWIQKEREEQSYRYRELRRHKDYLLSNSTLEKDYLHHLSLENFGHYNEDDNLKYRLQISVSVPVFEHTTIENITIQLNEENQRNATRQYPVNRLLGVAGVDIPLDHLKLVLPYHEVGPGGSLFVVDHRGNIVLHDNLKPVLDGDILKPGYRTVDVLDVELPGEEHKPRYYPYDWMHFRNAMILEENNGSRTMNTKYVYEGGMRAYIGPREYHWRRILQHYTGVIALPNFARRRAAFKGAFTPQLASEASNALKDTDFSIHPDWLYCRHVECSCKTREEELEHFLKRRRNETNFLMRNLHYHFSPIPPSPYEIPYQCDEELMARVCHDAIATAAWARAHEDPGVRDCGSCHLGSTTAFVATESGLTRWQLFHATSGHAPPPEGSVWARASSEPWYVRAASTPNRLVVHAPALPVRRMRKTEEKPATIGAHAEWYTAARTLGTVGVTGFHFHPKHLDDLMEAITDFPCAEDDEDLCEATCNGKEWECALVDDAGWILSEGKQEERDFEPEREGVRKHLATKHPAAMAALLKAKVFKLHWIHDYQGVCFYPTTQNGAPAPFFASLVSSLFRTTSLLMQLATNLISVLTVFSATISVYGDTQLEKDKRRKRVRKDYEREKYERLYDPRVRVNYTMFAACDRSRATYQLQPRNFTAIKLEQEADWSECDWPLVAAYVPDTNLLLVAVYKLCKEDSARPVPDPLANVAVNMSDVDDPKESVAGRLACWRNRAPLPGRPPKVACFPHNYMQEKGYRQCGPWIPDPEPKE